MLQPGISLQQISRIVHDLHTGCHFTVVFSHFHRHTGIHTRRQIGSYNSAKKVGENSAKEINKFLCTTKYQNSNPQQHVPRFSKLDLRVRLMMTNHNGKNLDKY